ncbi:topoisomerase DNA-binding C4 zinc finger domain-containing protein [Candidatus Desantisbacteria bacterium]|nr:topoisomerase DNA-binding C4 zinc finger domain-containing protein [Candidatus Desantisbacteria bacterium]
MLKAEPTDEKCPKCSAPLILRSGKNGDFFSCSKYPECKYTKSIGIGVICMAIDENGQECGGNIVRKPSRKGFFYGCDNYPACKFATWDEPTNNKCPNCRQMLVRKMKRGEEVMLCVNKGCAYNEGR